MANNKAESIVLHSGGTATEYPLLDKETYDALLSAVIRVAKLENVEDSHDELIAALQSAVSKLQETDTDASETLKDLDARLTKAQNTADSNTKKYAALSETVTNEQSKLANEVERAQDVEGDISDLNTVVRDSLVAAINYLLTRVEKNAENTGALTDLKTNTRDSIVGAVNELNDLKADQSDVDTMGEKVDNAVTKVETLENTVNNAVANVESAVSSVTDAVQKVDTMQDAIDAKADSSEVGDLTNLTTTEKSTLVGAINEAAASGGGTSVNVISPQTVTTAPSAIGQKDIAIGDSAETTSHNAIAIGASAKANGNGGSIAIGLAASAGGSSPTIAIGGNATANGSVSMAVGYNAKAYGSVACAIGNGSSAGSEQSAAIGYNAGAYGTGAVALGANSIANGAYTVSVGSSSQKRRIVNVADPTGDQDAATKAYVDNHTGRGKVRVPIDEVIESSCGEYQFSFTAIYKEDYEYELVEATDNIINTVTKTISGEEITISGTLHMDDMVILKMYKYI